MELRALEETDSKLNTLKILRFLPFRLGERNKKRQPKKSKRAAKSSQDLVCVINYCGRPPRCRRKISNAAARNQPQYVLLMPQKETDLTHTARPSLRRNLSRPGPRNPRPNMWGARDTSSLSSSSGDENTRSGSASKDNGGVI